MKVAFGYVARTPHGFERRNTQVRRALGTLGLAGSCKPGISRFYFDLSTGPTPRCDAVSVLERRGIMTRTPMSLLPAGTGLGSTIWARDSWNGRSPEVLSFKRTLFNPRCIFNTLNEGRDVSILAHETSRLQPQDDVRFRTPDFIIEERY